MSYLVMWVIEIWQISFLRNTRSPCQTVRSMPLSPSGGVYGATKGVPPEDIEKAQAALDQAIDRLKRMNLRQTLINEVVELGKKCKAD